MFDLAALSQAQQKVQIKTENRHHQSAQLYQRGREYIQTALAGAVDRAKLQKAVDCFTRGIQLNLHNPMNYVGMGFLFLLIQRPHKAVPFLKSALHIEPGMPLALDLMQQAQAIKSLPSKPSPQAGEVDFDGLHEQLEKQIAFYSRQLTQADFDPMVPVIGTERIQSLKEMLDKYAEIQADLSKQLVLVDSEMDSGMLHKQFQFFTGQVKRLANLIRISDEFNSILHALDQHTRQCRQLLLEARNQPETLRLEPELEALLDRCDFVADQLDALDEKGYDILPLKPAYRSFMHSLTELQDLLEEF